MNAQARAGISIDGSTLRYAEVEHYGAHGRLLRLGSCAFDFELMEQVLQSGEPAHLKTVGEALRDVFAGSVATEVHVALPPTACCSFLTPLPKGLAEAEQQRRLRREAALLMGQTSAGPFHLRADALYEEALRDGSAVAWFHVLALPQAVHARFDGLLRGLPPTRYRFGLSGQGAAAVAARAETSGTETSGTERPLTLAVGWYPAYTEYALLHGGAWRFGFHTPASSPADAAYFAVVLLERMGRRADEVGRVYVYGVDVEEARFEVLGRVFAQAPQRLSPMEAVETDAGHLSAQFNAEAYAPCVGAAL